MTEYTIPKKTNGMNYSKCHKCGVQKAVKIFLTTENFSPENLKFDYALYCYNCGEKFEV